MRHFTEKCMRNILAGGNAWEKWKCVSVMPDAWDLACLQSARDVGLFYVLAERGASGLFVA